MTDRLTYSIHIKPEFYSVRCESQREYVPGVGYVERVSGCGYLDKRGRPTVRPVWLTKTEARRIAARHRREHRRAAQPHTEEDYE